MHQKLFLLRTGWCCCDFRLICPRFIIVCFFLLLCYSRGCLFADRNGSQDQNISVHYDGITHIQKTLLWSCTYFLAKNCVFSQGLLWWERTVHRKKEEGLVGEKRLMISQTRQSPIWFLLGKMLMPLHRNWVQERKITILKGGRKALADLTNSSKLTSIAEEQILHNHQNCVKAQRKVMDMSCFLKEIGLDHGTINADTYIVLYPFLKIFCWSSFPLADDVLVHLGPSPHALKPSMKSKVLVAFLTPFPHVHI